MLLRTSLSNSSIKLSIFFLGLSKIPVICIMLLCVLFGIIPAIDSILLKNITDLIEEAGDLEAAALPTLMLFWAIMYGVWWESINLMGRVYDYLWLKTMPIVKGKIVDELYNYTQYYHHKFFQDNLAGHITNRITEGSRSLEMVFAILSEKLIRKFAVIIFALIAMYSVHYQIATIFFIWVCVFIGLSIGFSRIINRYSTNYAKHKSQVAGKIVDAVANISAIRMFTSHKFERRYLNHYINEAVKSDQVMQWFMLKLRYVLGLSCSIMIFTIIYRISILRGQLIITIGDCVLVLTLCMAVADDIWELTEEVGDLFEEFGAFHQSMTLIQPYIVIDSEQAKILQALKGEIEFRNVTFYYQNNKIFSNKSMLISAKQKVGLVGFSGSGKTTFVNLITRLYDIKDGSILIDGQNIKDVTQDSLRASVSIIPQEPILFHRTIMENIRYGKRNATDEEVIEAARAAYIHEFIAKLPDGYNTLCGERGNNLSGGQRQRVIIARAILKNAPILILDEATSSLDSATENLIQDSLKYLMHNKTVIIIAHRLATLLHMDKILVFNDGIIVEEGTHKELLDQGELYKKLWQSQITGLIAENP
ncbi:ABC transporter ATP-binding protein [Candidatus Trichorickettsia mobilis]|nr:ABC transporter ATP-binding protein [Candidatus Trichorickettsia mobilis]